ncbi:uncharacterized protein ACO6RY_19178 [Pungitius sinensis]
MSSRLAFQTQLASIMEVLANAAVAEICKLVDDDYAVVSLQMSQCQRENKALKRKLHFMELKMARGNAERRLRESAGNGGRARVQIHGSDRLPSPSSVGVFEQRMAVGLWPSEAAAGAASNKAIHSDSIQRTSPDVELVEPEVVLVKEEMVEASMSGVERSVENVPIIGNDGVVECLPRGPAGQRPSIELQDTQSTSSQSHSQTQSNRTRRTGSSRGVEAEQPDVVLVKLEEMEPASSTRSQSGLSVQEGLVESSTDDYRAVLPFDEVTLMSTNQLCDLQESGPGLSETAAPQSPVSQDAGGAQTDAPANAKTEQQRSRNHSEYSLFELETFFTRWAPDSDSASPHSGPSCPSTTANSAGRDLDGAKPPPGLQARRGSVSTAGRMSRRRSPSPVPTQQTTSRGTSMPIPVSMHTPSAQPPWSKHAAMIRSAQALLQQQRRNKNRVPPSAPTSLCTAASSTHRGDSSIIKALSSTAAPSFRGSAADRATLPARHDRSQTDSERRRKSYMCRACGKAFSGLSNLEAHERVHTGEKPFRCDTCGKNFSEAGNLKKHQRVHTGEKPFRCAQCGKSFAWICNLRTHQQSTGCATEAMGSIALG